jgi:hypothetical protein
MVAGRIFRFSVFLFLICEAGFPEKIQWVLVNIYNYIFPPEVLLTDLHCCFTVVYGGGQECASKMG